MVDIGPRTSTWDYDLGLKSIIPATLTLGLMGYPFVMAGPVGGVPVGQFDRDKNRLKLPDPGLYIRLVLCVCVCLCLRSLGWFCLSFLYIRLVLFAF
jgi:hypothetical protein